MKQFIRPISVLLISACLMQVAWAQFNVSGPGFLPDENGTNLDDPQAKKATPKGATVTVVKDCADCPEMVAIPAGSFVMGSMGSYRNRDEEPMHSVNLRSFLMGKTEVIQEQWEAVMGNNPSKNKGPTLPVENVSWDDVQQFIVKLNKKTGHRYRLPSEAEWEYAARAGTTTEWSHGNDESKLGDYAWYGMSNASKTQAVGQKLPNPFGLFDMHGNVFEWVLDCYGTYDPRQLDGAPVGLDDQSCSSRVLRGGSWDVNPQGLRSAFRYFDTPSSRDVYSGFRVARTL
jgi:formylglycine-generating enzyme required for sulfatase activity